MIFIGFQLLLNFMIMEFEVKFYRISVKIIDTIYLHDWLVGL